jgi:protein-tyrosine-phosphatase
MAAAIARREVVRSGLAWVAIESAGIAAREGEPAEQRAVEVAREHGCDIAGHRTRRLTPGLLDRADLVVVMEEHQVESVKRITCELTCEAPVITLGEDVADPIGSGLDCYRRTWRQLDRLIRGRLRAWIASCGE